MHTVDAIAWVNAFDHREPGHDGNRHFLEIVRDRLIPAVVPNLVLMEVAGAISHPRQIPVQAEAFVLAMRNLPHVSIKT